MIKHRRILILLALGSLIAEPAGLRSQTAAARSEPPLAKDRGFGTRSETAAVRSAVPPTYLVKRGDTLDRIARLHATTVRELKSINHLKSSRLQIGQTLLLRSPSARTIDGRSALTGNREPAMGSAAAAAIALSSGAASGTREVPTGDSELLPSGRLDGNGEGDASIFRPLRFQLLDAAYSLLGVRYRRNGQSIRTGFDCSGLVKNLFEQFRISLPRSSREQFKFGDKVPKDQLEPGDLVFFSSRSKTPTHVGIYVGEQLFLHAARRARCVTISSLSQSWYSKRFLGARRITGLWGDELGTP